MSMGKIANVNMKPHSPDAAKVACNSPSETPNGFPDTYLYIEECRSGDTVIVPIGDDEPLDLKALLDKWVAHEFSGELEIDGEIMPRLEGDYYARIMTDNRPPTSVVCWTSGGFYLTATKQPIVFRGGEI